MIGIMIIQWSHIEYVIVIRKLLTKCKQNQWENWIKETIKEGSKSDIVPFKVRLYYIKQQLNV